MKTLGAPAAARKDADAVSDHELVRAVRSGEERAFERLYERYHRRIAAYVYGMVNDYGRAEDITQEVFMSALRRIRDTERPIALKPWLYEIAKNACIDHFRRARRSEEVSFDADDGEGAMESARLASLGAGPDAAVDAKQRIHHLFGAFGGLSETHHQILVMRELEGLSYREIGDRLGLSRPSVESTLFRARRRLTEEFDELTSGERCLRVQSIIVMASGGSAGLRDQRRLLRHVAHCRPCRREARLAGVELETLSRHPVRDALASKAAALLPLPFLAHGRRAGDAALPGATESAAHWAGALGAAATILVGGAGTAAVVRDATPETARGDDARSAVVVTQSPSSAVTPSPARPLEGGRSDTARRPAGRKPQPVRRAPASAPRPEPAAAREVPATRPVQPVEVRVPVAELAAPAAAPVSDAAAAAAGSSQVAVSVDEVPAAVRAQVDRVAPDLQVALPAG